MLRRYRGLSFFVTTICPCLKRNKIDTIDTLFDLKAIFGRHAFEGIHVVAQNDLAIRYDTSVWCIMECSLITSSGMTDRTGPWR